MRIDPLEYEAQTIELLERNAKLPSKEGILSTLWACLFAASIFHEEVPHLSGHTVSVIGAGICFTLYQRVLKPTQDKIAVQTSLEKLLEMGKKATQTQGWIGLPLIYD